MILRRRPNSARANGAGTGATSCGVAGGVRVTGITPVGGIGTPITRTTGPTGGPGTDPGDPTRSSGSGSATAGAGGGKALRLNERRPAARRAFSLAALSPLGRQHRLDADFLR